MKIISKILFGSLLTVLISCNGSEEQTNEVKKEIEVVKTERTTTEGESKSVASIEIDGMTCAVGCAKRIEKNLGEMAGVVAASVDFDSKVASVEFDDSKVSEEDMINMIEGLGEYSINQVEVEKTVVTSGGDSTKESKESDEEASVEKITHRTISFPNIFDVLTRLYRL